ncbi:hypothetical protein Tco_0869273 [Tanacetum coccineum]
MHIFIGCFIYVVDFMILEDLGNIIDSGLSEVVLGKPFVHTSKLTYDESLGLIRFSQRDDEVVFRMPQRTKELDLVSSLEKDKFKAFFVENLKVRKKGFKHVLEKRKGYYKACMNLERTYKRDRETIEKLKTSHISIIKLITGLVYDKEEGTITFEKDKEKILFKMPYKMEMFKHIDFTDIKTDRMPPLMTAAKKSTTLIA